VGDHWGFLPYECGIVKTGLEFGRSGRLACWAAPFESAVHHPDVVIKLFLSGNLSAGIHVENPRV